MTCAELNESQRLDFVREMDVLRGAFVQVVGQLNQSKEVSAPSAQYNRESGQAELIGEGILGRSERIIKILKVISKMAPRKITLLLEGETGVGKELFARIIHLNSKKEKFVAVNCGAFPADLIESELFGHVKGAFTGANVERKGKFEEADGGTIFLDEIGELELSAQVKLLRVLEVGEIQRVGSDKLHKINVRVVTATNRSLGQMVEDNKFREDLYYRINMCPIYIPPLRERRDEIDILLEYFLQEICTSSDINAPLLSDELREFLCEKYDYPGNIRELKNISHYIAFIAEDVPVQMADLPERYKYFVSRGQRIKCQPDNDNMMEVRDNAEKQLLEKLLKEKKGNMIKVCKSMGISRSRVYQIMQKHQIHAADYRE